MENQTEKTDYAHNEVMAMIREYIATNEQQESMSEQELIIEYMDHYNVGMDMFNRGYHFAINKATSTNQ